jgi:ketosteroid isomerase-like protein
MAESTAESDEVGLLRRVYVAFNRREFETVLAMMDPDVDWPNRLEGGRLRGRTAVTDYWKRVFEAVDSEVEPQAFTREKDERVRVEVHQVVRDKSGKILVEQIIQHVYKIRDGLIQSMAIRESA